MGGGDEGSRDPPAPQHPVGVEQQGEGGLSHGGGGGRVGSGVKGITSHPTFCSDILNNRSLVRTGQVRG